MMFYTQTQKRAAKYNTSIAKCIVYDVRTTYMITIIFFDTVEIAATGNFTIITFTGFSRIRQKSRFFEFLFNVHRRQSLFCEFCQNQTGQLQAPINKSYPISLLYI